ncbi:hypothetical protein C1646_686785 [Rhizophagus diaphanus]|nr:hypothetical protein C1646_686785 [Rhizophagus diaphanus] [Rhizophagus sp. MUCL 43196]
MQSTSIQDFPPNSKRRLELQNQHNLQYQQFQQQQQQQQEISDYNIQEPPFKKHRPGIVANLFYKAVELATYTSTFATDTINTLTGNTLNNGGHSTRQNFGYDDDILQIDDDDENVYDHKKKDVSTWGENVETVEDEEPPPPYDNSWSMPSSTTTTFANSNTITSETKPSLTISTSSSQQTTQTSQKIISTPTHSPTNSSRRRQFRVRRGRRFIRRKSSSVDMSNSFNNTSTHSDNNIDDEEDIFLKFNCKLSDMIAEGKAALNRKVEVTEVEMILAEEKEREERIMKEFGIQSPISRRARTNFNLHNYSSYNNFNNNYNFY